MIISFDAYKMYNNIGRPVGILKMSISNNDTQQRWIAYNVSQLKDIVQTQQLDFQILFIDDDSTHTRVITSFFVRGCSMLLWINPNQFKFEKTIKIQK